jgi:hypothetical protein
VIPFREDPRGFLDRPPSEVEWEDLLVRVEIAPRALRVAVDDAGAGPTVVEALREGVQREALIQASVESMVPGGAAPDFDAVESAGGDGRGADELLARYESLRRRTFAMMQRRGLNVWDWRADGGPFDRATAYQLLQLAARTDADLLSAVRSAGARAGTGA